MTDKLDTLQRVKADLDLIRDASARVRTVLLQRDADPATTYAGYYWPEAAADRRDEDRRLMDELQRVHPTVMKLRFHFDNLIARERLQEEKANAVR